jgi:hypothetical protein
MPKTSAAFDWFVAHSSSFFSTQHGMREEIVDEPEWQHQQKKHYKYQIKIDRRKIPHL